MDPERETPEQPPITEEEAYAKAMAMAKEFKASLEAHGVKMSEAEVVAKLMDIILPPKAN